MIRIPKCFIRDCLHFQGVSQPDGTEMIELVICKAFPDGIPNEISYGKNLHLKPLSEQKNNIVFEIAGKRVKLWKEGRFLIK